MKGKQLQQSSNGLGYSKPTFSKWEAVADESDTLKTNTSTSILYQVFRQQQLHAFVSTKLQLLCLKRFIYICFMSIKTLVLFLIIVKIVGKILCRRSINCIDVKI